MHKHSETNSNFQTNKRPEHSNKDTQTLKPRHSNIRHSNQDTQTETLKPRHSNHQTHQTTTHQGTKQCPPNSIKAHQCPQKSVKHCQIANPHQSLSKVVIVHETQSRPSNTQPMYFSVKRSNTVLDCHIIKNSKYQTIKHTNHRKQHHKIYFDLPPTYGTRAWNDRSYQWPHPAKTVTIHKWS